MSSRSPRLVLASAAGALAAGAVAGAAAQALEIALVTDALPWRDALAAVSLAAVLGAVVLGAGLAALGLAAAALGRPSRPAARGSGLLAGGAGVFVLAVGIGLAWRAAADAPPGALARVTWAGLLASVAGAGLAAVAVRSLARGRLAAAFDPARPRAVVASAGVGIAVVLAALATWPPPAAAPRAAGGLPRPAPGSVVLVLLDTQRADALSPYGGPEGRTPRFARLAAEGLIFDEVISPSPWTIPSHASLFTGLYPRTHRAWFGDRRWLDEGFETLAERFASAGYETAAFVSNGYLFLTNVLQGFERQRAAYGQEDRLILVRAMRYSGVGFDRWIDKGSAETLRGVDAWLAARDTDRPFFLFVNLFEAHEAYHPPLADRSLPDGATNLDAVRVTRHFESTRWHSLRRRDGPKEQVLRALYAAEVAYQDRLLGELLDVIASHVELDDLVLAVTADHGENLGEDGRWGHIFALNDALVRVPLVIRAPGRVPAGERVGGAYQTLDLGPTLLSLAGLDDALGEGHSLLDPGRRPREETFAEVYPDYFRLSRLDLSVRTGMGDFRWPMRAIRRGRYKLVEWGDEVARLYDLGADPAEERDLLEQEPARARELAERLQAWALARPRATGDPRDGAAPLDEETRRRLEALGYL